VSERIPALKREREAPRTKRGKRLLKIVIGLFVIVLIVLFFRSPLSKISEIQVVGNEYMDAGEIIRSLGVSAGDSFFIPSIGKLKNRTNSLKPIDSVKIIKKFPGVLRVEVKEYPLVAIQLAKEGKVYAVLSNGLTLPMPRGEITR